jgi:hypothetical protein
MVLKLKNHYNASLGYGMWPAAAKSKAEAASQKDEVILKAMMAVAGSLNALQQKVDGMSGCVGSSTGNTPGTPTNKLKGPCHIPPGPGEPTIKMVDGVLNEWCAKCNYWTSGTKQHNADTHISRPCSERNPDSTPTTPTSTATIAAKPNPPAIKFGSDTKAGALNAASLSAFPTRNHLQMIESMFVASSSSSTTVPPPAVSPPRHRILENSTYTQPVLGTCEICGDEGASGAPCAHCKCPDVLYEVHYCGLCIVCGDYGCTGLLCLECGEDTGVVYGDPSFPGDATQTSDTTETVIEDRFHA